MAARREVSLWPQIDSPEKAKEIMRYGAAAAALYAAATACASYLAICFQRPIFGFDGWGMLDAVVFAMVAWRVYRSSIKWALIGFLFFTVSKLYWVGIAGRTNGVLLSSVFFLLYLHAARAGFYLRKAAEVSVTAPAATIVAAAQPHTGFVRAAFGLGGQTDVRA